MPTKHCASLAAQDQWGISVEDREWAVAWIVEAFRLGFDVFHNGGSGDGHPCAAEGES